jgi:hypothetical protein
MAVVDCGLKNADKDNHADCGAKLPHLPQFVLLVSFQNRFVKRLLRLWAEEFPF